MPLLGLSKSLILPNRKVLKGLTVQTDNEIYRVKGCPHRASVLTLGLERHNAFQWELAAAA